METSKCQVCGSLVEKGTKATICSACETPTHPECWEYNGGCATYACRESPALKNSKRSPVHIDGAVHHDRRANPQSHYPPPVAAQGVIAGAIDFVTRAIGMCIGLFVFFAFLAGFIEGITNNKSPRKRSRGTPSRATLIGWADRTVQLREMTAMRDEKRATLDEIKATAALAIWHTDREVRKLATEVIASVEGHEKTRQEYLCDLMATKDHDQRRIARVNILHLGLPTQHSVSELVRMLTSGWENSDESMDLLEQLQLPPGYVTKARKGLEIPPHFEKRLAALEQ